ncbi:HU family DNA-binding protein (plasmid) [Microvirga sp. VF16]|nr:HU family DNA-binding protein [Microvirga sp. VF16]
MIKSELVQKLAEHDPHLSRHDFEKIVDAILHAIRDGLARGDRVELRGFGTFALRKHAARIGCNPRTKNPVSVSEKLVPAFKAAKEMHQRLNPISLRRQNIKEARSSTAADNVRHVDAQVSVTFVATTASASHDDGIVRLQLIRDSGPDSACGRSTDRG